MRHPRDLGAADVTRFLSSLAVDREVSASTQNQALSGLVFLYREVLDAPVGWLAALVRAKRPARVPVVLTRDEVRRVLGRLKGRGAVALIAGLLYGSGMRLLEALRLRAKDLDFAANQITIRGGKGDRDRVTMLPERLKGPLLHHLAEVRARHERDVAEGAGWVELPGALGTKYPQAGRIPVRRRHMTHPLVGLWNLGAGAAFLGAPVLLPVIVSIIYFVTSPADQALRDRLLISAHGVLIAIAYAGAWFVAASHASSEVLAVPFVALLVAALFLMQRAFRQFRGPRRVHILQVVNGLCFLWTFVIGGMAVSGDAL
jgi:hypothetical protein